MEEKFDWTLKRFQYRCYRDSYASGNAILQSARSGILQPVWVDLPTPQLPWNTPYLIHCPQMLALQPAEYGPPERKKRNQTTNNRSTDPVSFYVEELEVELRALKVHVTTGEYRHAIAIVEATGQLWTESIECE